MVRKAELKRFRATVVGRVQGVGFRYFLQREASRLKLKGYVRNLANGNVEVVAEGPAEAVRQMLARVHEGPPLARVENVVVDWQTTGEKLTGFEIRSTGW